MMEEINMVSAKIPFNEQIRLQELYDSRLLDTPEEPIFDEIVKFAALLCKVPLSLIGFIDADRQWFKAKQGIKFSEIPREISVCGHTILGNELVEIHDMTSDERFFDNPLVIDGPLVKFYAGMPLVTSTGSCLGTLCVGDIVPGKLNNEQKLGLRVLAGNIVSIIELRIKNKSLSNLIDTQKSIISVLAHDVRNPLTSLKNTIELRESNVLDDQDVSEMMGMVASQLDSTLQMVENVVNWGQLHLRFSKLEFNDFNLHQLINQIFELEALNSLIKNNKLLNLVDENKIVYSDQNIIEFLLRNLISNANKFTFDGTISVNCKKNGNQTILTITDTGVGMTMEKANELLNGTSSNTTLGTNSEKGSGLGMLLVKEFIECIKGSITIESIINKGTTFTIIF